VPAHVAIIPDGNRRWARANRHPLRSGYIQGAQSLINTVQAALQLGIQAITVYSFSTENWRRSQEEVDLLMELYTWYLDEYRLELQRQGVRVRAIGDTSHLPVKLQEALQKTIRATSTCQLLELVLPMNYGGRNEIQRTMQTLAKRVQTGLLDPEDISEKLITENLDTAGLPDPDIIIRTSGEIRLSNFLLWQSAYSEVVILQELWPEFTPDLLLQVLLEYQKRSRRRGT
jgi:undecaprenyl diphosphate synthase